MLLAILTSALLLCTAQSTLSVDQIVLQGSQGNANLAFHIRQFLESSDGQYYIKMKSARLRGEVPDNSVEYQQWKDRLINACPNFSRLQSISDGGIIQSSFPFFDQLESKSNTAFSSPNFPWWQMLSSIPGYFESLTAGLPLLTWSDFTNSRCAWAPSQHYDRVYLTGDAPYSGLFRHVWGQDQALDTALVDDDKAFVQRIVAGGGDACPPGFSRNSIPASIPVQTTRLQQPTPTTRQPTQTQSTQLPATRQANQPPTPKPTTRQPTKRPTPNPTQTKSIQRPATRQPTPKPTIRQPTRTK